ncbi:MAG: M43 family zinc metalloprotease [Crocinitomicaceae bacterium]|nr:M43 family zinc metalloprotease [Crocinitomicaceae bacterium]
MKQINFLILFSFFLYTFSYAQNKNTFDPSNARIGEDVEYCHTHKKMAQLKANDAYKKMQETVEQEYEEIAKEKPSLEKGVVYTIPVVFHVLHNGGIENISDDQIEDAISILNRDFRLQNADAANVGSEFQGMPSDVEVEFALAKKAPNGDCFKGITRTMSPISYDGVDGSVQVTTIRYNNDVYQGTWKGNKYLNIFVCGEIGGAAGYTTNPSIWSSQSMTNGIWVLHEYVGSIGTSSTGRSRTLTHEVGHWLNLEHTWGPNNNPGNASSCGTDDGVDDTPDCIGVQACLLTSNTCSGDNSYWGYNIKDNVENYMDYSYCSKMYTAGQVTRMRTALQSTSTGRANLWQSSNHAETGVSGAPYLCAADFSSDKKTVCIGESVQFQDDSYNTATSWSWSFPSGTPATSTSQNPTISYSQPGVYPVTLTASDGTSSITETKSYYIRVLPAPTWIPYWEGFEPYSSINNLSHWDVYNPNNNNGFELESSFGHSGSKCVKLLNYGEPDGNIDELSSQNIDLSVVPQTGSVTLSFRYAYRKKSSSNYEYLKVFISPDCGDTWVQRKTLGGSQLSPQTSTNPSWAPASTNDWTTVHMVNVTSNYFTSNFRMKFRFESNEGNNFYLDDINLYEGSSSNDIVVGINSESNEIDQIELYPNPVENNLNIKFSIANTQKIFFKIKDTKGKEIESQEIFAKQGSNLIVLPTDKITSGTYFVELFLEKEKRTFKFVHK